MFGIKEKKKSKTIKKYAKEVNQNILNMITPFDRSHLNVSENIGTVLCISRYPAEAGFG